jgi:hypothetical protein
VAGRRAEVIIANPAGIQVNGGGFINAAGVTLTTALALANQKIVVDKVKAVNETTDSLIAATALRHDLRVVTRNVADFEFPGLEVVNPWRGGGR